MTTEHIQQKITPFLWFNNNAEEAMEFYTSIFKDARIESVMRYGKEGPGPEGSVMTGTFTLAGQQFIALNGGPHFEFTPAVSFFVTCGNQEEVDYYWNHLSSGGSEEQCGWLRDRFGLSWQIVPKILGELLQDKDRTKAGRVMEVMMKMKKIDIARLKEAAMD